MSRYSIIYNYTHGNHATTSIVNDRYGPINSILTVKNGSYLQRWNYDFNPSTGNLTSKKGLTSSGGFIEDNFKYDNLDKLDNVYIGETMTLDMS